MADENTENHFEITMASEICNTRITKYCTSTTYRNSTFYDKCILLQENILYYRKLLTFYR